MELYDLAEELFFLLEEKKLSICTAESITAGYLCGTIAKVSGVSRWLKGGLVCYSSDIKTNVLKVPEEIVNNRYAVTEAVARKMAESAALLFDARIAVSTTGFAESFDEYLPEAYIGIFIDGIGCDVFHLDLKHTGSRERARLLVVRESMKRLIQKLSVDNLEIV